jgi:hypothetical protein
VSQITSIVYKGFQQFLFSQKRAGVGYTGKSGLTGIAYNGKSRLYGVAYTVKALVPPSKPANAL